MGAVVNPRSIATCKLIDDYTAQLYPDELWFVHQRTLWTTGVLRGKSGHVVYLAIDHDPDVVYLSMFGDFMR